MSLILSIAAFALVNSQAASSAPGEQIADPLPAFEFKGIRGDQTVEDPRSLGLNVCSHNKRANEWTCMPLMSVAGQRMVTVWRFRDGLLRLLKLDGTRSDYPALLDAFTQRYGAPCRSTVEKWQNAMGASLDNKVQTWCFSGGELELREIGDKISRTQATYVDSQSLRPRTVVDF
jgi:hypothetical protein